MRNLFFLLICVCLCSNLESQVTKDLRCEVPDIPENDGEESTLCQDFGSNPGYLNLVINAQTGKYHTSLLSSEVYNELIDLDKDLVVDSDFTFRKCTIRIAEGVKITVQDGYDFYINDSKLFCCEELWKGIRMNDNSYIYTLNGTQIEDAERAIAVNNTDNVILDIKSTTFNRNVIGISLVHDSPSLPTWPPSNQETPRVRIFQSNTFSCTSPRNDGQSFGDHAIYMENVPLFLYPRNWNYFRQHARGITSLGLTQHLTARLLHFEDIFIHAIYAERGALDLRGMKFINTGFFGIHLMDNYSLNVDNCLFEHNLDRLFNVGRFTCIQAEGFNVNSETQINNCDFKLLGQDASTSDKYTAINMLGTFVFSNTNIGITNCEVDIVGGPSSGFNFLGNFPEHSTSFISNNEFRANTIGSISEACINITGNNINNFLVEDNVFDNYWTGNSSGASAIRGIILKGNSQGHNIKISENLFKTIPARQTVWSTGGMVIMDFLNADICENTFENCCLPAFRGIGTNLNTRLSQNSFAGNTRVIVSEGSTIDRQDYQGNKWYAWQLAGAVFCPDDGMTYSNLLRASKEAHCVDCSIIEAGLSKFLVHTDQSIRSTTVSCPSVFFSEYHPAIVDPDVSDEFFEKKENILKYCIALDPEPVYTPLMDSIANGTIAGILENNSANYVGSRQLYSQMLQDSTLEDSSSMLSLFSSNFSTTDNGKIYGYHLMIDQAISTVYSNIVDSLETFNVEVVDLDSALLELSYQLDTATHSSSISAIGAAYANNLNSINHLAMKSALLLDSTYSEVHDSLEILASLLNSQSFTDSLAALEKIALNFQIKQMMRDTFTDLEVDTIIDMAERCPRDYGLATYISRNILNCENYKFHPDTSDCYHYEVSQDTGVWTAGALIPQELQNMSETDYIVRDLHDMLINESGNTVFSIYSMSGIRIHTEELTFTVTSSYVNETLQRLRLPSGAYLFSIERPNIGGVTFGKSIYVR